MVGHDDVVVAERPGGLGHRPYGGAAVGPRGVHVAVAAQRSTQRLALVQRHPGSGLQIGQVGARPAGDGIDDHRRGARPDAVEVGQGAGGDARLELIGRQRRHHAGGPLERPHLLAGGQLAVEVADGGAARPQGPSGGIVVRIAGGLEGSHAPRIGPPGGRPRGGLGMRSIGRVATDVVAWRP